MVNQYTKVVHHTTTTTAITTKLAMNNGIKDIIIIITRAGRTITTIGGDGVTIASNTNTRVFKMKTTTIMAKKMSSTLVTKVLSKTTKNSTQLGKLVAIQHKKAPLKMRSFKRLQAQCQS